MSERDHSSIPSSSEKGKRGKRDGAGRYLSIALYKVGGGKQRGTPRGEKKMKNAPISFSSEHIRRLAKRRKRGKRGKGRKLPQTLRSFHQVDTKTRRKRKGRPMVSHGFF